MEKGFSVCMSVYKNDNPEDFIFAVRRSDTVPCHTHKCPVSVILQHLSLNRYTRGLDYTMTR